MLTKEHLQFRTRNGRALPVFLREDDAGALALARDMTEMVRCGVGQSIGDVEEALSTLRGETLAPAFQKLLLDACDAAEDNGQIAEERWRRLLAAQALRREKPGMDVTAYQATLAADVPTGFDGLKEALYADLPACRQITSFKELAPEALVWRYNCAQVQGLLLRARSVTFTLKSAGLAERRAFFRQLKFHRLMGEVSEEKDKLCVTVSGPLSIFEQASTYGLRLATFFPHVVNLSAWEVTAEVHIKNKNLILKLDEKCGLKSHYQHHVPYIPEELTAVVATFNERDLGWKAELSADFVHIGRESYCFPDITITGQDGTRRFVELFHRWHAGPLKQRLQALEKSNISDLRLGVAKGLAKSSDVSGLLADSQWFHKYGFIFSEFPTPKALVSLLSDV